MGNIRGSHLKTLIIQDQTYFRLKVFVTIKIIPLNCYLKWLEDTFLPYLTSWEASVSARSGFPEAEKKSMLLSKETLDGLRMTSKIHFLL